MKQRPENYSPDAIKTCVCVFCYLAEILFAAAAVLITA